MWSNKSVGTLRLNVFETKPCWCHNILQGVSENFTGHKINTGTLATTLDNIHVSCISRYATISRHPSFNTRPQSQCHTINFHPQPRTSFYLTFSPYGLLLMAQNESCKVHYSIYSRTPLIWMLVMISQALRVNLSRILWNKLALKLPIIRSSMVQRYGF